MAYPQDKGGMDKVLNTGRILYGGDGTNFYPVTVDSNGNLQIEILAGTARIGGIAQREPFIFRPGSTALASGMVASGTRSASGTVTTGTVASSTYWGVWQTYTPLRSGKIDGVATGGIVEGQIIIGVACSAGTGVAQLTARIANTANTAAPTTMLALTGTMACTTAETYKTYDAPYLKTDTVFNSVPFSVSIGAQHSQAGSSVILRLMETSWIRGEFEPGT